MRVADHLVGGAVLDRAARVHELALGPELDAGRVRCSNERSRTIGVSPMRSVIALGDAQARAAARAMRVELAAQRGADRLRPAASPLVRVADRRWRIGEPRVVAASSTHATSGLSAATRARDGVVAAAQRRRRRRGPPAASAGSARAGVAGSRAARRARRPPGRRRRRPRRRRARTTTTGDAAARRRAGIASSSTPAAHDAACDAGRARASHRRRRRPASTSSSISSTRTPRPRRARCAASVAAGSPSARPDHADSRHAADALLTSGPSSGSAIWRRAASCGGSVHRRRDVVSRPRSPGRSRSRRCP